MAIESVSEDLASRRPVPAANDRFVLASSGVQLAPEQPGEPPLPAPGGLNFLNACVVWVPNQLMHRARWVVAWEPPSDAELTFLATGEIGIGDQAP